MFLKTTIAINNINKFKTKRLTNRKLTLQNGLFKVNNLYQLKPKPFKQFFQKKLLLLFGFTELADLDNEKQPMKGHFGQKPGLTKLQFLLYSTFLSKIF